jgi:hypothetical protein
MQLDLLIVWAAILGGLAFLGWCAPSLKTLIIATGRAGLPLQSPLRRVTEADIRASLQHGCFGPEADIIRSSRPRGQATSAV